MSAETRRAQAFARRGCWQRSLGRRIGCEATAIDLLRASVGCQVNLLCSLLVSYCASRLVRQQGPRACAFGVAWITIRPWADAQHPYFKTRPRTCRSEVLRAGPPKSSICPHGTAAYVGPRRLASERVPGVVVGLPWGHRRWGSNLELSSSCRPGGRPKTTASVTLGEWGRRRAEGGGSGHATTPTLVRPHCSCQSC